MPFYRISLISWEDIGRSIWILAMPDSHPRMPHACYRRVLSINTRSAGAFWCCHFDTQLVIFLSLSIIFDKHIHTKYAGDFAAYIDIFFHSWFTGQSRTRYYFHYGSFGHYEASYFPGYALQIAMPLSFAAAGWALVDIALRHYYDAAAPAYQKAFDIPHYFLRVSLRRGRACFCTDECREATILARYISLYFDIGRELRDRDMSASLQPEW